MSRLLRRLIVSALVGVVLAEGILWIFHRAGYEPAIENTYWQKIPGLKEEVTFSVNQHGLRTRSITRRKKPPETLRVLCLGHSTTEQATHDTEDMWATLLEDRLDSHFSGSETPVNIQVAAYAKGGSKVHEILHWAAHEMPAFSPDVVITLFGINSLAADEALLRWGTPGDYVGFVESTPGNQRLLQRYSQIYRHARTAARNAADRRYLEESGGLNFDVQGLERFRQLYPTAPVDSGVHLRPGRTALFRALMGHALRSWKEAGYSVVVLGQPLLLKRSMTAEEMQAIWFLVNTGRPHPGNADATLWRLPPAEFLQEMGRFNDVQRSLASSHGHRYLPLEDMIDADLEHFFDDCHFTDKGSVAVADAVFPAVAEALEEALRRKSGELK